jgi:DNA-binding NarL/FixJ family response regulator
MPLESTPAPIRLSKRQIQVIRAWANNPDPEVVANELQISVHTVQTHLRRMRRKCGVTKTVMVWMMLNEML